MPPSLRSESVKDELLFSRCDPGYRWIEASTAARMFGRTRMTINRWCKNGTLASAGCPVRQDLKGRWYVQVFVGLK